MVRPPRWLGLALAAGLGVACGDPGATGADAAAGPSADAATGAVAGRILVLDAGGLGALAFPPVVQAAFPDGADDLWYREVLIEGSCRVRTYEPGLCDPACAGVCVAPATCRPYPTYRSAGVLTVSGLAAPVSIDVPFDGRYSTFGGLPSPLFGPDAAVTVVAAGGEVPAFTVDASAPAPIALPGVAAGAVVTLSDGADLTLSWPGADDRSRVQLMAHSGGAFHGTPPAAQLICDLPDTGTLTIPRAAIEALPTIGPGCAKMRDCAHVSILRYRSGRVATAAGEVELRVGTGTDYAVMHP